jgi:hypothetical protein
MTIHEKIIQIYRSYFAIREIEESRTLKYLFYVIVLSFFTTFFMWVSQLSGSINSFLDGSYVCPPYLVHCYKLFFYEGLPFGYSQSIFYTLLFLTLVVSVISSIRNKWALAHVLLLICFLWKVIYCFIFTYGVAGNFDYYDLTLCFVWLFVHKKEHFSRLTFVWLYFLASTIKIHDGWIFGNYLTTLITGAPLFPNSVLPIFTNVVIIMQIVGCWFLFSKNKNVQEIVFYFFLFFHTYSGFIVNYRYITISIPALIVLFYIDKTEFHLEKISKKTIAGYFFLLFLLLSQSIAYIIPGDQKKTLEGDYYGLYMFEANHQCISKTKIFYSNSTSTKTIVKENHIANNRCDPYRYYFVIKSQYCKKENVSKISWDFYHSINGHSYEQIVSTDNICTLQYSPLTHNSWINISPTKTNFPVYKNGFGTDINIVKYKIPATPIENSALLSVISSSYWLLWTLTLISSVVYLLYITLKKDRHE